MGNTRIAKWDNMKFFLMLAVVMGHTIDFYIAESGFLKWLYFFIYTFHMPAFVFVSGLFMKNTVKKRKYDKIFSYLVLGFVIKLMKFIANCIVGKGLSIEFFNEDSAAWYAFAIFVFALVTIFLQRFNKTYVFILAIVLGMMVGYDKSVDTYLSLARIFAFYPFFFAGFCLDGEKIISFTDKIWVKIISAVVFVATGVLTYIYIGKLYWLIKILKGKYTYKSLLKLDDFGGLLRLAHYAVAFILIFAIIALTPKIKTFLSTVGSRTLPIYSLHTAVITLVRGFGMDDFLIGLFGASYVYAIPAVAVIIVFVTSLKPFGILLNKIITPPLIKEEIKKVEGEE